MRVNLQVAKERNTNPAQQPVKLSAALARISAEKTA
jgi:hypothetical protein